jgi:hypothetical protein
MSHSSQTHGPHTRKGTTLMVQTWFIKITWSCLVQ